MRKKLLTTDSTLCGYIIMPVVCTLYGYQDSALNHMVFKCLFGNPSDADKRSESKINTKQIIFVYRGERSKDRSHTFSKISCLFETTQEEIFILIV